MSLPPVLLSTISKGNPTNDKKFCPMLCFLYSVMLTDSAVIIIKIKIIIKACSWMFRYLCVPEIQDLLNLAVTPNKSLWIHYGFQQSPSD